MNDKYISVTALTRYIKYKIDNDVHLQDIYIRGEISNFKAHTRGHFYFTIKDETSRINAIMFSANANKLPFTPEDGMKVLVRGKISVFESTGNYQIYVSEMLEDGVGNLYVAFEQLKKKLLAEGLFDEGHKKALPRFPHKIAVITSPTGAAVRDILRILKARFPMAEVLVCPVLVQGPDAPADIASMIEYVNRHNLADLIITGRGGGSIEDLWGFNDESVARAIYNSEIPVISAVGHEPDVTISDFVADVRAATPANAAEIAVPDSTELRRAVKDFEVRAYSSLVSKLNLFKESLKNISEKKVMQSPQQYFAERRLNLDFLAEKLAGNTNRSVMKSREKFARLVASLDESACSLVTRILDCNRRKRKSHKESL